MPSHSDQSLPTSINSPLDCEITHRIDSPHQAGVGASPEPRLAASVERLVATCHDSGGTKNTAGPPRQLGVKAESCNDQKVPCLDPCLIGIAHAEDLLDYVQRLSEDLDTRSAKLHADIAVQERRERAFRLWAQQRSEDLRIQREDCERERQQLKTQARRMALTENVPAPDEWYHRGTGNR